MNPPGTILLSRPDPLGDAVVTLSTAGWVKRHLPAARIIVLCKEYARAIWSHCSNVDAIMTLEELQGGEAVAMLRSLKAYQHLRKILKNYYYYLKENPSSLITKFFGLHKLIEKDGDGEVIGKSYFIIMANVFNTA